MKSFFKFLIFLGIGLALLYFVYVNQAAAYELECRCKTGADCQVTLIQKVVTDFKGTNFFWLFVILMAFMVSNLSRALRWNQLIEPLGYKPKLFNTFFATMIGYMVNLALPRAGEIAKPATVAQYEKIPLEKLVGTIVVDRAFDVMMLLLVTGLTFLTQFTYLYDFLFGEGQPTAECLHPMVEQEASFAIPWLWLFVIAVGIGFLVCLFIVIRWKRIKETALAKKAIALIGSFISGVKAVSQLKRPGVF
ncbi:MAG: flippase-like domain-containing protein, partial [Aureispira sp.]|nr:flippase-like domain-containing protein [Aureispira sp.]